MIVLYNITAIAEDPEVRQLILELKGEFGQSQEISLEDDIGEERMPRARRMSVKRISQQAKEELAKQSVQDEVTMRRESMVQHVSLTTLYCVSLAQGNGYPLPTSVPRMLHFMWPH